MELMRDATTLERMLFEKAERTGTPVYGVLELTPVCNMNCRMCYVRMSSDQVKAAGGTLSTERLLELVREMAEAGMVFVLLTGGEPLLHPQFRYLYTELRKMGMVVTINTNGTLIDEEWADFFASHKPRRINITLYGQSGETYRKLCGYEQGYDRAVKAVKLLRSRGVDVKINGSLTRDNLQDREGILEFGEELGVPVRIDTYMYPAVRERGREYCYESRMDPETAGRIRAEVLRREMGEETFLELCRNNLNAKRELEGMAAEGQMSDNCMTCKAGRTSFLLNWQGFLRGCVLLDRPQIDLRNSGFKEAWEILRKEVRGIKTSTVCAGCSMRKSCFTCAASAAAETGRADGVPEYLCRMTETFINELEHNIDEGDKR